MNKTYRIADINIYISSMYPEVHTYCSDYSASGTPDIVVNISQADIDFERSRSPEDHCTNDAVLERTAVHRKIAEQVPNFNTVLIHGSALAVDGKAYLFTAPSGTGKSTHSRLWCALLGSRVVMINDDKPFVRIRNGQAEIFGTPWNGKHRLGTNISVPLKAICILERSDANFINRIEAREAYPFLLLQTYRPLDKMMFARTLSLLDELAKCVEFYRLGCNINISAAELAYNTMKG